MRSYCKARQSFWALFFASMLLLSGPWIGSWPVIGSREMALAGPMIWAGVPAAFDLPADAANDFKQAALEITVVPQTVAADDALLLQVQLIPTSALRRDGAKAALLFSGTVGYFPPPVVGVSRSFILPFTRVNGAFLNQPLTVVVTLLAAHPNRKLRTEAFELLAARIVR